MKRLVSIAFIGALAVASLTACSAKGAGTDFCDVSTTLNQDGSFTIDELSDAAMTDALAGDMTAVNEWGATASGQIDAITAEIERAKGGAPSDEASKALDDVLEAMGVMSSFADAAAASADVDALAATITSLGDQLNTVDTKLTDAAAVLDKAAKDFCD